MAKGDSLDRTSLSERIESELRRRIADGTYPPHSYIPAERQLTKEFGVARATVSKALTTLQADGLVEQATGRGTRVLHPLDRMATPVIGIVHGLSSMTTGPAFRGTLAAAEGAQSVLRRLGYRHEVASRGNAVLDPDWILTHFGAAILISVRMEDWEGVRELQGRKFPVVAAKLEYDMDMPATYVDHEFSSREAVRTLASMGHRRIALVAREPEYAHYGHVLQGYRAGLAELGLPNAEQLIGVCEKTDGLSGYFAAKPLLELPEPPTAIIAGRDTIAEGVCRAATEAGHILGSSLSIIGFDDMTWPHDKPFLTTFREPCQEMGAAAVNLLVERIVNPSLPVQKVKFETPLVLRRSAGPPLAMALINVAEARKAQAEFPPSR